MVKGTFAKVSKVVLFVVNILFWLLGVALLGVGIYSEVQRNDNEKIAIINSSSSYAPIALIVGGALVFIVGFSGCCGAMKEHRGLLVFYSVLVFIIFAIEMAGGIYGFVRHDDLQTIVTKGMMQTQEKYNADDLENADTKAWDSVQSKGKCCGVKNYTEWENVTRWTELFPNDTSAIYYPASCCAFPGNTTRVGGNETLNVCEADVNKDDFYTDACFDTILSELKKYWKSIAGVAVGIAVFELLVIVMACCLQSAIKKDEYTAV